MEVDEMVARSEDEQMRDVEAIEDGAEVVEEEEEDEDVHRKDEEDEEVTDEGMASPMDVEPLLHSQRATAAPPKIVMPEIKSLSSSDEEERDEESVSLLGSPADTRATHVEHVFSVREIGSDEVIPWHEVEIIRTPGVVSHEPSSPLPTVETPPTSPMRDGRLRVDEVERGHGSAHHEPHSLDEAEGDSAVYDIEPESSLGQQADHGHDDSVDLMIIEDSVEDQS